MDGNLLRSLLEQLQSGILDVESVLDRLKTFPFEDLGFAKIDSQRCIRTGVPEVIFCQGKTIQQIQAIIERISVMTFFRPMWRSSQLAWKVPWRVS